MRRYILTAFLIVFACQVKSQIQKPMVWLKSDSLSMYHRNLRDAGNLDGTISISGTGTNPDSAGFNYNPSLYFTGQSKIVDVEIQNGFTKFPTFLIAYEADTSNQKFGLYSLKQDTNLLISLTTQSIKQKGIELVYSDSTNMNSTVNVLSHKLNYLGSTGQPRTLLIGTDEANKFKGKIAEIIIFNNRVNSSIRRRYETYLALKYSVTLEGVDYYNMLDSCIWKKAENEMYHFGIAGLGKDSLLTLNQKQSAGLGGKDVVGISAHHFAQSNDLNSAQLPEGQYLIWGHSNYSNTDIRRDTVGYDSIVVHLKRTYRIRCYGDSLSNLSTQVVFHTSCFTGYENPFLKLRRAETAADIILFPDSIDMNGSVYFSNLYWDIDSSGYDEFSFGFQNEISQIPLNNESMLASTDLWIRDSRSREGNGWNDLASDGSSDSGSTKKLIAKVYPNPSLGPFSLAVSTSTTDPTSIMFYDYAGRVVLQHEVRGNMRYQIDNLQLAKGHYFLVVQNPAGRKVLSLFIYE